MNLVQCEIHKKEKKEKRKRKAIQSDDRREEIRHRKEYAAAKSLQSCPTLCDPTEGSPPGSPVPGILQARTLEWVAISFSNAWKWKVKVKSLSRVRLLATPWTAAYQGPPSMGLARQEDWSGVPSPSPFHLGTFPKKSLALSACASHWTIHFRVLDKSPLSGPGRGSPFYNNIML